VMDVTHSIQQSELTAVLCWSELFTFDSSHQARNKPMPPERLRSFLRVGADQIGLTLPEGGRDTMLKKCVG